MYCNPTLNNLLQEHYVNVNSLPELYCKRVVKALSCESLSSHTKECNLNADFWQECIRSYVQPTLSKSLNVYSSIQVTIICWFLLQIFRYISGNGSVQHKISFFVHDSWCLHLLWNSKCMGNLTRPLNVPRGSCTIMHPVRYVHQPVSKLFIYLKVAISILVSFYSVYCRCHMESFVVYLIFAISEHNLCRHLLIIKVKCIQFKNKLVYMEGNVWPSDLVKILFKANSNVIVQQYFKIEMDFKLSFLLI